MRNLLKFFNHRKDIISNIKKENFRNYFYTAFLEKIENYYRLDTQYRENNKEANYKRHTHFANIIPNIGVEAVGDFSFAKILLKLDSLPRKAVIDARLANIENYRDYRHNKISSLNEFLRKYSPNCNNWEEAAIRWQEIAETLSYKVVSIPKINNLVVAKEKYNEKLAHFLINKMFSYANRMGSFHSHQENPVAVLLQGLITNTHKGKPKLCGKAPEDKIKLKHGTIFDHPIKRWLNSEDINEDVKNIQRSCYRINP